MKLILTTLLVSFFIACSSNCIAQEMDTHGHGHSARVGRVRFPVSCTPLSQKQFGNAVALLHSFWYEESATAFAAITKQDPRCAMAYWGQAMSIYHPLWEQPSAKTLADGRALIQRAKVLKTTQRESDYISALDIFYSEEHPDYVRRALAYEASMKGLYSTYPGDDEAAVFYGLALISSAQALPPDRNHAREKEAATILDRVLAKQPSHPGVAHYLIHAYDSPALANLALNAARSYAKIAPAVPHALHMPSHIFTRLGLWEESIKSNLDSEAAAITYARRIKMGAAWDQQLHAMDYLAYAYLQIGRDDEAKAVLEELQAIDKASPEAVAAAYAFAAIPARYAIERRQWEDAAKLELRPAKFAWDRYPWALAIVAYARGIGAARTGDAAAARQEIERLAEIAKQSAGGIGYNWAGQVEIQRLSVAAWAAYVEGKTDEAVSLMREAADREDASEKHPVTPGPIVPARELLGELLMAVGEPGKAFDEFVKSLETSPRRFTGLYGAARAAELAGARDKAGVFYRQLLEVSGGSRSVRPELREAQAFVKR